MGKKKDRRATLISDYHAELDELACLELCRSKYTLAKKILDLVQDGMMPNELFEDTIRTYPHRWIEAQAIKSASRYMLANGGLPQEEDTYD